MMMRFFEDYRALDSLRHSDFDDMSAYGEVIDNSIQAEATEIAIKFELSPPRHAFEQISTLAFGDNGHGMPKDILHACLKLGYSSRFNDRSGIGRFGVGMVLGAIHEVQRVEVYSKEAGGPWLYTYMDLEEIKEGDLDSIPEPKSENPPEKYLNLVGKDQGTLVLWSKYDNQKRTGSKIRADAEKWIGRTFRYFIWDGVKISIDGNEVPAHDPLFIRTDKTAFPNDPTAKKFKPIEFSWPVSDSGIAGSQGDSKITINMSQLPEEFRPVQGSGNSTQATMRRIDENNGISILRNRREVFYGQLPYWTSVKIEGAKGSTWRWEEIDRWWGCEVLFSAELDNAFSVRNIKRGAEPEPKLKGTIKKMITPTRNTVLEEVRRVWEEARKKKDEEKDKDDASLGRSKHRTAEEVAKRASTPESKFKKSVNKEDAAKELEKTALRNLEADKRAQYLALFQSQPFTIQDDHWRGQTFWEVYHAGGNALLSYNLSHSFFIAINDLLNELEHGEQEPEEVARRLRELIDLLLISMAKAQSLHDDGENVGSVGQFIEGLNNQWGLMLSNYVREWQNSEDSE